LNTNYNNLNTYNDIAVNIELQYIVSFFPFQRNLKLFKFR